VDILAWDRRSGESVRIRGREKITSGTVPDLRWGGPLAARFVLTMGRREIQSSRIDLKGGGSPKMMVKGGCPHEKGVIDNSLERVLLKKDRGVGRKKSLERSGGLSLNESRGRLWDLQKKVK